MRVRGNVTLLLAVVFNGSTLPLDGSQAKPGDLNVLFIRLLTGVDFVEVRVLLLMGLVDLTPASPDTRP